MMSRWQLAKGPLLGWCMTLAASVAVPAAAQNLTAINRELADIEASAQRLIRAPLQARRLKGATYVEERLADAELFYRLKDYTRAAIILTDIVEHYPDHRAHPEALMMLADALRKSGDLYGARTHYRLIVERSDEPGRGRYAQQALARLIDIAVKTRDFRGIEDYFERLSKLPPTEVEAGTAYARAKYYYNRAVHPDVGATADEFTPGLLIADADALRKAEQEFAAIPANSPYRAQADYFLGVIHTLESDLKPAIAAFKRAVAAKITNRSQQRVHWLAHLALGRLFYETDQPRYALLQYESVPRTSEFFDAALYETAWVHLKLGNSIQAERTLEVLALAVPDSSYIPDAKLLRGDLLLRDGQFVKAEGTLTEVNAAVRPVTQELEKVLAEHEDPKAYFRTLVEENFENFDLYAFVPERAQHWADPDENMSRGMHVLSDYSEANKVLKETNRLVERLQYALSTSSPVNVFADLRLQREQSTALRNRLAWARRGLVHADAPVARGDGRLAAIRKERRQLEEDLRELPRTRADFEQRNVRAQQRYSRLNRELKQLDVELMGVDARAVAIEQFLEQNPQLGAKAGKGAVGMVAELRQHQKQADVYRDQMADLRVMVEQGQLQVGVGDKRHRYDEQLRRRYAELVRQERDVLQKTGRKRNAAVDHALFRAQEIEAALERRDAAVDSAAEDRAREMLREVGEEVVKLQSYEEQLAQLADETSEVVGGVAYANFQQLRQRFYDLVMRADVGLLDIAWARREEHRMRVEELTRGRARQLQALDDEFQEVMDEQRQSTGEDSQ